MAGSAKRLPDTYEYHHRRDLSGMKGPLFEQCGMWLGSTVFMPEWSRSIELPLTDLKIANTIRYLGHLNPMWAARGLITEPITPESLTWACAQWAYRFSQLEPQACVGPHDGVEAAVFSTWRHETHEAYSIVRTFLPKGTEVASTCGPKWQGVMRLHGWHTCERVPWSAQHSLEIR